MDPRNNKTKSISTYWYAVIYSGIEIVAIHFVTVICEQSSNTSTLTPPLAMKVSGPAVISNCGVQILLMCNGTKFADVHFHQCSPPLSLQQLMNLQVCIHFCAHACAHTHTHTHTRTHTHTHACTHACTCMHACTEYIASITVLVRTVHGSNNLCKIIISRKYF